MRTNLTFPTTSRQPSLNTREFCTTRGTTMKSFMMKLWKRLCLNLFSQGEWNCLADLMASCCMVNWGVDIFSTSELPDPNRKIRLQLIRARLNFYKISDNPNVNLGIVDCSLDTRRIVLKADYHNKRMDLLAYTPVEFNCLETLAKTFIIPEKTSSFKKTFSTMLQFVVLLFIE